MLFQNNEANLLGQKNEVSLLKLLFLNQDKISEAKTDHIIFGSGITAFELEDLLLNRDFKKALKADFDIDFNQLFTITNMPISRFLDYLVASENYEDYMYALVEAYNPAALENVMCTNTLSVRWDGYLYDCDFNQMLNGTVHF